MPYCAVLDVINYKSYAKDINLIMEVLEDIQSNISLSTINNSSSLYAAQVSDFNKDTLKFFAFDTMVFWNPRSCFDLAQTAQYLMQQAWLYNKNIQLMLRGCLHDGDYHEFIDVNNTKQIIGPGYLKAHAIADGAGGEIKGARLFFKESMNEIETTDNAIYINDITKFAIKFDGDYYGEILWPVPIICVENDYHQFLEVAIRNLDDNKYLPTKYKAHYIETANLMIDSVYEAFKYQKTNIGNVFSGIDVEEINTMFEEETGKKRHQIESFNEFLLYLGVCRKYISRV